MHAPRANVPMPNGGSPPSEAASAAPYPHVSVPGQQSRSHLAVPGMPNGPQPNPNFGQNAPMGGGRVMPQAQMQANMSGPQQRFPQNDARMILEVSRVQREQEQQRFLQQQQRQQSQQPRPQSQHFPGQQPQGQPGPHSSPNMNGMNTPQGNAIQIAMQAASGMGSPSIHNNNPNIPNPSSASPRMGQPQQLSNGTVPAIHQITSHLRQRNPQASDDDIRKMSVEYLGRYSQDMTQRAISAAAGGLASSPQAAYSMMADPNGTHHQNNHNLQPPMPPHGMPGIPPDGRMQTPHDYASMMRAQQQNQANRHANANGTPVPSNANLARPQSRSATPQMPRSGSVQAGPPPPPPPQQGKPSQSPMPPQAQIAS